MDTSTHYEPPRVWSWDKENGGTFQSVNRPFSGARYEQELPTGNHPLQIYSIATPNGVKVTVMLEELLEKGIANAEYDAWLINIFEGEQFGSGFTELNPNSKIPALIDKTTKKTVKVFESGSILLYLAEKFDCFLPQDPRQRASCYSWLFWQMVSAPFLGGGFGHFYAYAPEKLEYPINRYAMEVKRQLDVLDKHFSDHQYICGDEYTIADMAIYPWYGQLVEGALYDAAEFLSVSDYKHIIRWAKKISQRPAVIRGRRVNKIWGDHRQQLAERHHQTDLSVTSDHKT